MSKTIDILGSISAKRYAHNFEIQDEIAKTYFHTHDTKKEKTTPEGTGGSDKKGPGKWRERLPWLIAAIALTLAAVAIFFKSSVDIKVHILSEIPALTSGRGGIAAAPDKGIFLIRGGEPNKDIVKNVYFSGDGQGLSAVKPDEVVLHNAKGAGWANWTIEFKDAIDLNRFDIKYTAKGAWEDEYLTFIIVDANNSSYRLTKDISSTLDKDWQKYTINFNHIGKAVDLSNISRIKFEFGNLTAGNRPSAVVFLKDVYITKAGRSKWL